MLGFLVQSRFSLGKSPEGSTALLKTINTLETRLSSKKYLSGIRSSLLPSKK